jgi:DNA-binding transcriptional MocR family regulator
VAGNEPLKMMTPQDSGALARLAVEDNVVLAPGNVFSVSQTASSFLRFNVAQSDDPRIVTVLGRAMRSQRAE